jgi:hypothetical protein
LNLREACDEQRCRPDLREQFEALLSKSLPSVKRRQPALPAPANRQHPIYRGG